MTRVLPLPAAARISTGPLTVSTASRCWGFNCERYDKSCFQSFLKGRGFNRADKVVSSWFARANLSPRGGHRPQLRSIRPTALGGLHQAARLAILAGAMLAKELPRIDAVLVPVVPGEADAVLPYGFDLRRTRQRLENGQRARHWLQRIARLPAVFLALFHAKGTGTRVAQEHEGVGAAMAIFPLDVHTVTRGFVDLNRLGICDQFHEQALCRS